IGLKMRLGADTYYLAGGTELNSLDFKKPVKYLISIEKLGLNKINKTDEYLSIGAGLTIQELIDKPEIPKQLKTAASHIVNRNIRNIGTLVGNIGANKSCSNLIPILLALDAELTTATPTGEQKLRIEDFVKDKKDELIVSVNIKQKKILKSFAVKKYSRTANDISIITSAVVLEKVDNKVKDISIAVGGVDKCVIRLRELENKLKDKELRQKEEIEGIIKNMVNPIADIRGSAEFKKYMCAVLVVDCIFEAFKN
ncbi:MAG TPA: FAD binding domain-containing protein, partial [bacterium]|nr:FAD binding domain-containing protein [bacterium]